MAAQPISAPGIRDSSAFSVKPSSATYRMRALANPGPGVVLWTVKSTPDFAGASAPSAIQPGTAVVMARWS